jgi:calcium/calmodulin-dependent protein kinase I
MKPKRRSISLWRCKRAHCNDNCALTIRRIDGEELFERIVARKGYTEEEAARVIGQLLHAVEYMHSKNIVHRDIKVQIYF